jgi:hypothetical protein
MNSEMINEMKIIYKEYLQTEKGKKSLFHACIHRREALVALKNGADFNNTARVRLNTLCKEITDRTKLVTITPIGLNNVCHDNADVFSERCGFERRLGWNITACRCGRRIGFELHSLNKKDGVLYDFTKDMCDETEKYFVELDTNMRAPTYMNNLGCPDIFYISKNCKCEFTKPIPEKYELTEGAVRILIDMLENMRIYC